LVGPHVELAAKLGETDPRNSALVDQADGFLLELGAECAPLTS
jgi:hypothetical protein